MMTQIYTLKRRTPKQAAACCRPIDDLLDAELFKGLCDPTRLKLLACLAKCGRACSVGEIGKCCEVDISVVSRHLAQLHRAGVLESAKRGRTVFYSVDFAGLSARLRNLADAVDECCPSGKGTCCAKR
jgi:ArsR family transcriptional regulator